MDDLKIRKRANEIATSLNNKYPGIIHEDVVNLFLSDLYNSELSDVEINEKIDAAIERVVKSYTDRKNKRRNKKEERQYDLNDMFDCRITDNTLHIHVVPKSVKDEIKELGLKIFLDTSLPNIALCNICSLCVVVRLFSSSFVRTSFSESSFPHK